MIFGNTLVLHKFKKKQHSLQQYGPANKEIFRSLTKRHHAPNFFLVLLINSGFDLVKKQTWKSVAEHCASEHVELNSTQETCRSLSLTVASALSW